jgi:cytochrome bd ubiquinol oxidase subunit I
MLGLKSVGADERPNVPLVFFSFRVMVGLWLIMAMLTLCGLFLYWKNKLYTSKWFLRACLFTAPIGFISVITGWFTAEFGRQPWIIYKMLKTSAAVSSSVSTEKVIISLASIACVYGVIFGYFYFRYFFKLIHAGPKEISAAPGTSFYYLTANKQTEKP